MLGITETYYLSKTVKVEFLTLNLVKCELKS
jgi:hypothetical protein